MKRIWLIALGLMAAACEKAEERTPELQSAIDIVSFNEGYSLYDQFSTNDCNPEQMMAGLKAAIEGKKFPFTAEEGSKARQVYYEGIIEKRKLKNLEDGEKYLERIAKKSKTIEKVPGKLYYQIMKEGNGEAAPEDAMIEVVFKAFVLWRGKVEDSFGEEKILTISSGDMIPGFAKGVVGMRVGEKRKLYIHPDLAFGSRSDRIEPNQLLIMEIELKQIL